MSRHNTTSSHVSSVYVAALVLGIALVTAGCGRYPHFSQRAYDISASLYNVCSQQRADKLGDLNQIVEDSLSDGQITADEAGWLSDVIAQAEAGDWQAARLESRTIMEDQVVR